MAWRNNQQGGGQDDRQERSVFVGNLEFRASEDEVGNAFSKFGNIVNVKFITDRETGRPRGFGFGYTFANSPSMLNDLSEKIFFYWLSSQVEWSICSLCDSR